MDWSLFIIERFQWNAFLFTFIFYRWHVESVTRHLGDLYLKLSFFVSKLCLCHHLNTPLASTFQPQ